MDALSENLDWEPDHWQTIHPGPSAVPTDPGRPGAGLPSFPDVGIFSMPENVQGMPIDGPGRRIKKRFPNPRSKIRRKFIRPTESAEQSRTAPAPAYAAEKQPHIPDPSPAAQPETNDDLDGFFSDDFLNSVEFDLHSLFNMTADDILAGVSYMTADGEQNAEKALSDPQETLYDNFKKEIEEKVRQLFDSIRDITDRFLIETDRLTGR